VKASNRPTAILLLAIFGWALTACTSFDSANTGSRGAGWYTVKPTDTLYSIAWRYGLDYHQLAGWNNIDVNTTIFPGQRLRLIASAKQAPIKNTTVQSTSADTRDEQVAVKTTSPEQGLSDPSAWIWPTQGIILNTFSVKKLDRRGIDIAGKLGQSIKAVASGRVVYSGNGLAGYGNLIIVKHSDTYLSAYAYCQDRLVNEGAMVKAGNEIAKMGLWDKIAKLHFEIRKNGKPVNPLIYLPKQ
jgi:lipoprotein NlpD